MLQKLKSRKFIVALIAQVTGLIVLFYPEHTGTIEQAAANVGALLLMALSGVGYIAGEASIDRANLEAQKPKPPSNAAGVILIACMAGLFVGASGGCAATPEDRWYQARDTVNVANKVFIAQAPNLTDERIIEWGQKLIWAQAQLEHARTYLPEGGVSFDSLLDSIEAYLAGLAANSKEPADVQPSNSSDRSGIAPDRPLDRGVGAESDDPGEPTGHLHPRAERNDRPRSGNARWAGHNDRGAGPRPAQPERSRRPLGRRLIYSA